MTNPWLSVPLADYESHMRSPAVQQLDTLADLFGETLKIKAPLSIAILGIAGGNGLDRVYMKTTQRIVGVDINPEYLDSLRERYAHISNVELYQADLSQDALNIRPVELVHAALLFEHAGTLRCLENALRMVAPEGSLSVVLQLPSTADQAVGSSEVASVTRFAAHFRFVNPREFSGKLAECGFRKTYERTQDVASGKAFRLAIFDRSGVSASGQTVINRRRHNQRKHDRDKQSADDRNGKRL